MATVWFAKEGEIQVGFPIAEKPVAWCVENLGLRPESWIASLKQYNLTIGQKTKLGEFKEPRFVVVELEEEDLHGADKAWKLGFYLLAMSV